MKKILGLDFGEKRIGLAISDETGKFARPYGKIVVTNERQGIREIKKTCQKENVGQIIIGLPLTLRGEEGKKVKEVKKFAQNLQKEVALPIIFQDERFTSKEAERILRERKNKSKDKIDTLSAMLILNQYMQENV